MMAMTAVTLPAANSWEDLVVHTPTRGGGPARFGPGVPLIPDIGPGILDADVDTDPERYQRQRTAVLAPSWKVICLSPQHPGDARRLTDRADSCLRSAPAPSAVPARVRRRAGA